MRLLNIKTLQLESFENWNTVPPYAILSHTWEDGEVLFHDVTLDVDREKKAWKKVLGACHEAEKLGLSHVWVDTCCIFKESSAELSESINSMFAWYRDSRICFAYMGDVVGDSQSEDFWKSKWWSRGWTLQELIAPTEVMFFNESWNFLNLRTVLAKQIAQITGIAEKVLMTNGLEQLHHHSVAEKLCWAAKRKTTRGEDRAYSLLGLFGVNMSMIYGEGEEAAFFRLQREVFSVYADHSIFAWSYPSSSLNKIDHAKELLAPDISAFEFASDIISEPYNWGEIGRPKQSDPKVAGTKKTIATFSSVSHGLRVQLLLEKIDEENYIAYLACRRRGLENTCLTVQLCLDLTTGRYSRGWKDGTHINRDCQILERLVDSHLGYKVTLHDVYIAQPLPDIARSDRRVRCKPGWDRHDIRLYVADETLPSTGFEVVDYCPLYGDWISSVKQTQSPRGKQHFPQHINCAVIYRDKVTDERFAIYLETAGGPAIGVVVDRVSHASTATDIMARYNNPYDLHEPWTDLSQSMLIKRLESGKQVLLSMNAVEDGIVKTPSGPIIVPTYKVWIAVKRPAIYVLNRSQTQ
ncbi:heterokaryon incompatibility protein-domain-containing protein [Xylogone sp. PMI_703]|nr:heterokaryon incompatibility protein-domain-containing protein [Xylogone sp. PMI_703]